MSGLLAIVPARQNSKGLPGKALKTVGGTPMILRTLRTVEESGVADRIVVSTDGPEIAAFCRLRGYEVLDRPAELAEDDVPVIEVVRHAIEELRWADDVALFQPTCPLLKPDTVKRVIDEADGWTITASADPHIHWLDGGPITVRNQRQDLDNVLKESGAIHLMRAADMDESFRPTTWLETIKIDPREALDIDTPEDLALAEKLSRTAKIGFVVAAGERVGTGHLWRSKALAEALAHHEISWTWCGEPPDWAKIDISPLLDYLDLLIFDRLTPDKAELLAAKQSGSKVVVLEDESEASRRYADLLVNDMLDPDDLKYAVLRSEFLHLPEREHRDCQKHAPNVLVTFGGTDPANLTRRIRKLVDCRYIEPDEQVQMAEQMRWADLVITSQGRTVLEAAACGTPCISIASNEREARHIRIPGVTYLGLHTTVTDDQIRQVVSSTLADKELRIENARAALRMIDGRGLDRLVHRIEGLLL